MHAHRCVDCGALLYGLAPWVTHCDYWCPTCGRSTRHEIVERVGASPPGRDG